MTEFEDLKAAEDAALIGTYGRLPLVLEKGEGMYVFDRDGARYLDMVAGIAVCITGHCHPHVVEALREQAGELIHCSNLYHIPQQVELAQRLSARSQGMKAFFCNSGAEANEAAIKIARKYSNTKAGRTRGDIITLKNSFHGRTMKTLAATGQTKYQKGFEPIPSGFSYATGGDIESVAACITDTTAAIMVELIQGEGGIVSADKAFITALRALCDDHNLLLIIDEIQTGVGRTGAFFCYEHYGVVPDIVTLAKGLGSGVPIGAMLAQPAVAAVLGPGTHGSTFGGNPLACAAALATLEVIDDERLITHANEMGAYFVEALEKLGKKYPFVNDIRGRGLMLGVNLALDPDACRAVQTTLMNDHHILINVTAGTVLRFVPPLIIEREHIDACIAALDAVFAAHV